MIFPGELVVTKQDTAITKVGAEAGDSFEMDCLVFVEPGWLCFVVSVGNIVKKVWRDTDDDWVEGEYILVTFIHDETTMKGMWLNEKELLDMFAVVKTL